MSKKTWKRAAAGTAAAVATAVTLMVAVSEPAGAKVALARATLLDASGNTVGEVVFRGRGTNTDQITVEIDAPGAPAKSAFHGIHVHTTGVCTPAAFTSAGGHWNPTAAVHGFHAGDLPSILLDVNGQGRASFESERIDVSALIDSAGDGSAVVLHAGPDNFAHIPTRYSAAGVEGPDAATLGTGDAGPRFACGVIVAAED